MPKTLVIDDDPKTEPLFRRHLKRLGPAVEADFSFATSDQMALDLINIDNGFEIVLVTIDSAHISGMNLFHQIKDQNFKVPRVALTNNHELTHIRKAMNEGAADFLAKPFSFEDMVATIENVYEQVERRRKAWSENAELSAIRREISVAADIQQRILPKIFPAHERMDIHAEMTPARDMGGDFYDVFSLKDGRICFVIADVAGKSVPAAFYMAVARTLFRASATGAEMPSNCLLHVNQQLCQLEIPGMFVSAFYGIADPDTGKVTFANAGHPHPCLIDQQKGTVTPVKGGGGTVLGVIDTLEYENDFLILEPGQSLYMCTDGVTEAFDTNHKEFGEARLWECLSKNSNCSAVEIAEAVSKAVWDFSEGAVAHDDITSLIIKRS